MTAILKSREAILALILVLTVAGIGLYQPVFLEAQNLGDMLTETSVLFMMALAQMVVILTRGIDLSVAANLALSGMIAALVSQYYPDVPLVLMILTGVARRPAARHASTARSSPISAFRPSSSRWARWRSSAG